jgi:DNA-binding MarR family transcriptional regulator
MVVGRSPEDRRRHLVELTDTGANQLAKAEAGIRVCHNVMKASRPSRDHRARCDARTARNFRTDPTYGRLIRSGPKRLRRHAGNVPKNAPVRRIDDCRPSPGSSRERWGAVCEPHGRNAIIRPLRRALH